MNSADTSNFLCGFYELTVEGIILYARLKEHGKLLKADSTVVGFDLFKEIFKFDNAAALRRHFQNFVTGKTSTESFIFGGEMSGQIIPFRVMLARGGENNAGGHESEPLFFLDIKPD